MATYLFFWSASLFSGLWIRRRLTTNLFLVVVFLFIGLRLDTGFDWPVYKKIYLDFETEFTLTKLALYSTVYGQEPGFLFLLGLASQYFPTYEAFQALVTVALLWSTVLLSRTLGVTKVAMVVAIALSYLMWSVGFSTLRQSMAISLFNFGLVMFLRHRSVWGAGLFFLSVFFQLSGLVYIAAFIATRYLWRSGKPPALRTFLIASVSAALLAPLAVQAISIVSPLAEQKIRFYLDDPANLRFGIMTLIFLTFFCGSALLASSGMARRGEGLPGTEEVRRLIMVLSAAGVSFSFFSVMRDRVSYELFLLCSILVMTQGVRYRWQFVVFLVLFGLVNSGINIFPFPRDLAFVPYQNVIISYALDRPSTGSMRNSNFMDIISEMNRR